MSELKRIQMLLGPQTLADLDAIAAEYGGVSRTQAVRMAVAGEWITLFEPEKAQATLEEYRAWRAAETFTPRPNPPSCQDW